MKRLLILLAATATLAGCGSINRNENYYTKPQFYAKYLDAKAPLDRSIQSTLQSLEANPNSAPLHNQLGSLLVQKGFRKDARKEFERSIDSDRRFYPAWYNLGLVEASNGNPRAARSAFDRTVRLKPGHAAALFQMGLMEENRGNTSEAIALYAKAFSHNRALLDVHVNPQILDSKVVHLVLLELYPTTRAQETMTFQPAPAGYIPPQRSISPQSDPANIVTPTAPPTDPGTQTPPPAH